MDHYSAISQPANQQSNAGPAARHAYKWLLSVVGLIAAGLMTYAVLRAFVWDEGFHLIAAQLINQGKRPYLDFCFPQPPLNAYWNAVWLRAFGYYWWVPHIPAALETSTAVLLTADFVFSRFQIPRWRLVCAICAAVFLGLNTVTVEFGTIAQAYGIAMLLVIAAFRMTIATVNHPGLLRPATAGLLASGAAASTLLSAAVAPILLIWSALHNRAGKRWAKLLAFLVGGAIPFIPVIRLFIQSPQQVWFNVVSYQALYRRINWNGATLHDIGELLAWTNSGQALLIALLALAGILSILKSDVISAEKRDEFSLCGWLALLSTLYISTAHPTFVRYYIVVFPFYSILAAVGVYAVGSRLDSAQRPLRIPAVLVAIFILALGKHLLDNRDGDTWQLYQQVANKVEQVTPPNGSVFAEEVVYFLLHRDPPPGMEFSYSHKLELPPAEERLYHIVSERELASQLKKGVFDTAQSCNDDEIDKLGLDSDFLYKADVQDCTIYWAPLAKAKPITK
jgi:hypothetical protein